MLYGEVMTVLKLKNILEELIKAGKGEVPIGLVSNNHSCQGDVDGFTISECHLGTKTIHDYIVIGNWNPDRYNNTNFKFDSYIYEN